MGGYSMKDAARLRYESLVQHIYQLHEKPMSVSELGTHLSAYGQNINKMDLLDLVGSLVRKKKLFPVKAPELVEGAAKEAKYVWKEVTK